MSGLSYNTFTIMIYIALFRGINVGGKNKVDMSKLKSVLEHVGFTNIITYINSGNVIFKSSINNEAKLAQVIEQVMKDEFQLDLNVVVINNNHLNAICSEIPSTWVKNEEMRTDVMFLWEKYDNPEVVEIINLKAVDSVKYVPGALLWNVKGRDYGQSGNMKLMGTDLYRHMTIRNVNTVRKLQEIINTCEGNK